MFAGARVEIAVLGRVATWGRVDIEVVQNAPLGRFDRLETPLFFDGGKAKNRPFWANSVTFVTFCRPRDNPPARTFWLLGALKGT